MYAGFLPIAAELTKDQYLLLPKLHQHRCCAVLHQTSAYYHPIHIPKSVRKKAKHWNLKINTSFDLVVQYCHEQHGIGWLYPPIVEAFRALYEDSDKTRPNHIRLHSIECWNDETGELGAGELGVVVGSIYTSLTGFCRSSGAGTIQLGALAGLLRSANCSCWDLGMGMAYKYALGAVDIPRREFVHLVKTHRQDTVLDFHSIMATDQDDYEMKHARDWIDVISKENTTGLL